MVEANEKAGAAGHIVTEDEVGGQHADEDEELLAGQAHDGQRDLHQRYQLAMFPPLHSRHLRPVLLQLPAIQCATRLTTTATCVAAPQLPVPAIQ